MTLMHHDVLRVNAKAPIDSFSGGIDADAMEIYAESGWVRGEHPDTDLDDPAAVRRVLPPKPAVKAPKSKD